MECAVVLARDQGNDAAAKPVTTNDVAAVTGGVAPVQRSCRVTDPHWRMVVGARRFPGWWPGPGRRLGSMAVVLGRWRHQVRVGLVGAVESGMEAVLARRLDTQREHFDHRLETVAGHLRDEIDALRAELHAREVRDRRDMLAAGERAAVASSAALVQEQMPGARTFPSPRETLEHALSLAPDGGMALEFGVYSGTTLTRIAEARGGVGVYGFDSFVGLPEDWRAGFSRGTFAVESPPQVPGAELVIGWFADTLPGFLAAHPGPVDVLHLDADLYSSTATVLAGLGTTAAPGLGGDLR